MHKNVNFVLHASSKMVVILVSTCNKFQLQIIADMVTCYVKKMTILHDCMTGPLFDRILMFASHAAQLSKDYDWLDPGLIPVSMLSL